MQAACADDHSLVEPTDWGHFVPPFTVKWLPPAEDLQEPPKPRVLHEASVMFSPDGFAFRVSLLGSDRPPRPFNPYLTATPKLTVAIEESDDVVELRPEAGVPEPVIQTLQELMCGVKRVRCRVRRK